MGLPPHDRDGSRSNRPPRRAAARGRRGYLAAPFRHQGTARSAASNAETQAAVGAMSLLRRPQAAGFPRSDWPTAKARPLQLEKWPFYGPRLRGLCRAVRCCLAAHAPHHNPRHNRVLGASEGRVGGISRLRSSSVERVVRGRRVSLDNIGQAIGPAQTGFPP